MRYFLNYQHLPKGASRPIDDGQTINVEVTDEEFALIPSVGDYVSIDNTLAEEDRVSFAGKVKSRLFRYVADSCLINIVIEEEDDDWGVLIKE